MPIIMFINLKGGVAKTTNTVAVAECLASMKYKTLVIDADHQCMAGELLIGQEKHLQCEKQQKTLYHLLWKMFHNNFDEDTFPKYVINPASNINGGIERLSVMPSCILIDDFGSKLLELKQKAGSAPEFSKITTRSRKQLRKWLSSSYDYVLIDCPPSLAVQVKILLSVADSYIVPCIPDYLSTKGMFYLDERLEAKKFKIRGLGILWTLFLANNAIHKEVVEKAAKRRERFEYLPEPFEVKIPSTVEMSRVNRFNVAAPSTFSQKYHNLAVEYKKLCQEIIQRSQWEPEMETPQIVKEADLIL